MRKALIDFTEYEKLPEPREFLSQWLLRNLTKQGIRLRGYSLSVDYTDNEIAGYLISPRAELVRHPDNKRVMVVSQPDKAQVTVSTRAMTQEEEEENANRVLGGCQNAADSSE